MSEGKDCIHCGTPFLSEVEDYQFCCAGCEVVYGLLFEEGLDRFYMLKGDRKVRPARDRPFQTTETEWVETLIETSEGEDSQTSATVHVSGATCVGCVWLIETLFLRLEGAVSASVDPSAAEGTFTWQTGSTALLDLARELPQYGYTLDSLTSDRVKKRESKKLLPRLGVSAALALNTMAFSLPRYLGMNDDFEFARIFDLVSLVSSTLALLIGGSYFFKKAIGAMRQRTIHMDLPISLGLGLAFLGSCIGWLAGRSDLFFFDFVAIFTTLMLAGRYIHLLAVEQVSHRLQGQSALVAEVTMGDQTRKATDELEAGDVFELPPNRALPVSARLDAEDADFSLAWMTGEPVPKLFSKGRVVPAGAISLSSKPISLVARESYGDSIVSKLYKNAAARPVSLASGKFLKFYLISIICIGIIAGLSWFVFTQSIYDGFQVAISIFVISCPCAIGVALPLVERRISSAMADYGVFIQQTGFWQNMLKVKNVILDKTGTLTLEHPDLKKHTFPDNLSDSDLRALAALTGESVHPLDRSLQQVLISRFGYHSTREFTPHAEPGVGSSLQMDGNRWTLGKVGWRGQNNFSQESTQNLACEFARDGHSVAVFEFGESLRPDAVSSIQFLREVLKLPIYILSGDNPERIQSFAERSGVSKQNAFGGLSPDDKQEKTADLQPALYLGDGMNDAAAFGESAVTGTPVTDRSVLDRSSGFIFTCEGLSFLPTLFRGARWARDTTRMVVAFTIVYNVAAITTCCLGKMTPLLAAILMPISSIVSIGIALRSMKEVRKRG